jgi:hypothetical protein
VTDLLKLNNIVKRNGDIKAFPLQTNMIEAHTGKNGWGRLIIAIDNNSIVRMLDNQIIGVLFVFGKDEWEAEKTDEPQKTCALPSKFLCEPDKCDRAGECGGKYERVVSDAD